MQFSKPTIALVTLVAATASTSFFFGECMTKEQANTEGICMLDDNGIEYTLIDNGDGTETARYSDGGGVTFRRNEDGSLDVLSGAGLLLSGIAAGYFFSHGIPLSSPGMYGSYEAGRWKPSVELTDSIRKGKWTPIPTIPSSENETPGYGNGVGRAVSSALPPWSKNGKTGTSATVGKSHSGFGGAGVRGGSS